MAGINGQIIHVIVKSWLQASLIDMDASIDSNSKIDAVIRYVDPITHYETQKLI